MNGNGASIGKALRSFTSAVLPDIVTSEMPRTRADTDWCLWSHPAYPAALKALMNLPVFTDNERSADAYICGYYRGLKEAVFQFDVRMSKRGKVTKRAT
jgi:hypothetical protein